MEPLFRPNSEVGRTLVRETHRGPFRAVDREPRHAAPTALRHHRAPRAKARPRRSVFLLVEISESPPKACPSPALSIRRCTLPNVVDKNGQKEAKTGRCSSTLTLSVCTPPLKARRRLQHGTHTLRPSAAGQLDLRHDRRLCGCQGRKQPRQKARLSCRLGQCRHYRISHPPPPARLRGAGP